MAGEKITNPEDRFSRLSALPAWLHISDSLELQRIDQTVIPNLFDIITRNLDIRGHVAWASKVHTIDDIEPALRRYSGPDIDGRYAIIGEGDVVGYVGIRPSKRRNEYAISYFLDSTARGKGYVTSAVSTVIEQAKTYLGAEQIYLQIASDNAASNAIPERLGFQRAEIVMGVDFPVEQQRWRLDLG